MTLLGYGGDFGPQYTPASLLMDRPHHCGGSVHLPLVGVVADGGGQFTHLGRSTMVSPHTTNVMTGETLGDQVFTAANGDTLTAYRRLPAAGSRHGRRLGRARVHGYATVAEISGSIRY
jgi:hypothetical protein